MKPRLQALCDWFDRRLAISEVILPTLRHPVPRALAGPEGWWYVFGSAALTLFLLQIVTGIGLALVYVPVADKAHASLEFLNYEQPLGWFLRALHNWGATGMVILVVVHMIQVFLHAAYRYPRELTWMVGVVLLLCTLGMAFTGQVLRWDEDAYWGIGIGAAMAGRVPFVGPDIVRLLLGGPTIGGDTLSRFFSLHVFIIPGFLIGALCVHLWLVLKKGVSEPPEPGKIIDPDQYDEHYKKVEADGIPFFPDAFWRDAIFSGIVVLAVVIVSAVVGPSGPKAPPDPSLIAVNPRPDWYFLWLFAVMAMAPAQLETPLMLIMPPIVLIGLFALPFILRRGERAPSRRPIAVLSVLLILLALGVLTWYGMVAPWSPDMTGWSGAPVPERMVKGNLSDRHKPTQLMGAAVLQNKNCRNCHALDGQGGQRGPDLTTVGTRLSRDELIRQVLQGGGDMPAYGKQLNPAEVETLATFLVSLRPAGELPVRDRTAK